MKQSLRHVSLLGAILALGACQAAPGSLAADSRAVPPSLADRLPVDTIAYLSLPDIQGMREEMQKSSLARIFHEPDMQNFLAGVLEMLDQAWDGIREQAVQQGIPVELTHWEALRSFEMGLALRPHPEALHVFDQPPHIYGVARLGLAEGLGSLAYRTIADHLADEMPQTAGPHGASMVIIEEVEAGVPVRLTLSHDGDAVELEFTMGSRGEGSLAATENFRRAWNRNMTDGAVVFGFLGVDQVLDALLRGLESEQPEAGAVLRPFFDQCLAPLQSVSFGSGWSDDGSFMNSMVDLAPGAGPQWRNVPLDKSLAAHVPANATSFSILGADSDPWMQSMLDLLDAVGAMQPEGMPMPLASMLAQEAPELHDWLFGSHRAEMQSAMLGFGKNSFSYTVPKGTLGSESLMFVELDDPASLSRVLEQLMPRLRQAMNAHEDLPFSLEMRRVKLETTAPDGSVAASAGPAYYWLEFEIPPEAQQIFAMLQLDLKPCFGITPEGWMVMSISKQSVADALRGGMKKPDSSILENEEAAAFLARLPRNANSASWSDPRPAAQAALGMIGGMMPMVASMVGDQLPVPIDFNAFPGPDTFVRNMRTSESWSWELRGDFMSRSVGSMGFADLFSVLAAVLAVGPPAVMIVQDGVMADSVPSGSVEF